MRNVLSTYDRPVRRLQSVGMTSDRSQPRWWPYQPCTPHPESDMHAPEEAITTLNPTLIGCIGFSEMHCITRPAGSRPLRPALLTSLELEHLSLQIS